MPLRRNTVGEVRLDGDVSNIWALWWAWLIWASERFWCSWGLSVPRGRRIRSHTASCSFSTLKSVCSLSAWVPLCSKLMEMALSFSVLNRDAPSFIDILSSVCFERQTLVFSRKRCVQKSFKYIMSGKGHLGFLTFSCIQKRNYLQLTLLLWR